MPTSGCVRLSKIKKMLQQCAPGHRMIEQPHSYRIEYGDRVYPALQLGRRNVADPEIQRGHIKKLVRALALDVCCVKKHLPQIGNLSV